MKKFLSLMVVGVILLSCMFGCANSSTRYSLYEIDFLGATMEHYEYHYIEFNNETNTYKFEQKAKVNGIITKITGDFFVDKDGVVRITCNEIPSQNYIFVEGESLYFEGNYFYIVYGNYKAVYKK